MKGRLSTVDLFVQSSAKIIYCFTKQATLIGRSTVLSLPLQLVVPVASPHILFKKFYQEQEAFE